MTIHTPADRKELHTSAICRPRRGQLVEMQWMQPVVADVQIPPPLNGHSPQRFFLAPYLVEKDSVGKQLRAVWEIGLGTHIIEHATLTISCQNDTGELEAFLNDAFEWSTLTKTGA